MSKRFLRPFLEKLRSSCLLLFPLLVSLFPSVIIAKRGSSFGPAGVLGRSRPLLVQSEKGRQSMTLVPTMPILTEGLIIIL